MIPKSCVESFLPLGLPVICSELELFLPFDS